MSMNAIILGSVDFLRSSNGLNLDTKECDEQPDGQPPPMAGQRYFAISEGDWSNSATESLDETYGVEVTITLRAGVVPVDRINVALKQQLRIVAAQVRAKIHMNYNLMAAANAKLNASVENVFVEPLRFRSAGKIQIREADWFWAHVTDDTKAPSGVSITLVFGGARRVQTIESQT